MSILALKNWLTIVYYLYKLLYIFIYLYICIQTFNTNGAFRSWVYHALGVAQIIYKGIGHAATGRGGPRASG